MSKFIVFDVETPNHANDRMSAIGITITDGESIREEFFSLINPETYFDSFNIQLTGINGQKVKNSPNFPELWEKIEPIMSEGILVAHNAVFDMGVLKKCLQAYEIEWKKYVRYLCTVQIGRRLLPGMSHKLNDLCDYYGISLEHHQAASDSRACAQILSRYIEEGAELRKHIRTYSF